MEEERTTLNTGGPSHGESPRLNEKGQRLTVSVSMSPGGQHGSCLLLHPSAPSWRHSSEPRAKVNVPYFLSGIWSQWWEK